MAVEARISVSEKNAWNSTGLNSEAGKANARLKALNQDERAGPVAPVLPENSECEIAAGFG